MYLSVGFVSRDEVGWTHFYRCLVGGQVKSKTPHVEYSSESRGELIPAKRPDLLVPLPCYIIPVSAPSQYYRALPHPSH